MESFNEITGNYKGKFHLEYLPCINYAMMHNHIPSCNYCELVNEDDFDWNRVKVSVDGSLIRHSEVDIEGISKGSSLQLKTLSIEPEACKLIELTERIDTVFTLSVSISEAVVSQKEYPVSLLAYDQWPGIHIMPELLAAFVTPNHPLLSKISVEASRYLEKWTGDSALDEYQTQDPNRVRMQVAAIYEALRSEALGYCASPAGFEQSGQRVRLVDDVLTEKLATCLDSTLLYASCLEANGIHPLLVLLKGHVFVGAWLTENFYSQTVGDDASFLLKGSADGIHDIVLVESTALSSSKNVPFEEAVEMAVKALKEENRFELFVDVFRCRLDNICPLPLRANNNGQWCIDNEGVGYQQVDWQVNRLDRYDIKLDGERKEITKQMIWERKLLDFSLRNNLINIRLGKRVIPFISFGIDRLEDQLQAGENYRILPNPAKGKIEPTETGLYDSSLWKERLEELVINELKCKNIHSYLTDSDLQNSLKFLYRASRTALEENGANSLFLVLGVLRWYESSKSVKPRFAPILLLPVDIIRRGGSNRYVIRTRDEETMLNITLVELLKQQFNLELPGLEPLPKDENGVDIKRVFATIRACIRERKRWNVVEESMLGLFSFNKFVMWNDIHTNADLLKEHPVLAGLMANRLQWQDAVLDADAREADRQNQPAEFALPIDVDSSQLEAVIESGEGKSFILHGPPGTGKSQTITNMIANALYQNKRVLFVAEKMAALSVVQNRLARIGLEPFCLEMHSNKATKAHFLAQLQKALEVTHIQSTVEYKTASKQLYECRKRLIDYMEALHRKRSSGYSLYDCITRFLAIEGDEIQIPSDLLDSVTGERLAEWSETIGNLDTVFQVTGHPADHPLRNLQPLDVSLEGMGNLMDRIGQYKAVFSWLRSGRMLFARELDLPVPDTFAGLVWMGQMSGWLVALPLYNKAIFDISRNPYLLNEWNETLQTGVERDAIHGELLRDNAPELLDENAWALRQEWKAMEMKWFIPRFFAKRSLLKRLRLYNGNIQETQVPALLEKLVEYQKRNKIIQEHSSELASCFEHLGRKGKEKWSEIATVLEVASAIYNLLVTCAQQSMEPLTKVFETFVDKVVCDWTSFRQANENRLKQIKEAADQHQSLLRAVNECGCMELPQENVTETVPVLLDNWLLHSDRMKDWCQWCFRKAELENLGLSAVVDYILAEHASGTEASEALQKGVYRQMAMKSVDKDESLRLFNGLIFEEVIQKYRRLTSEFQELSKRELYCRLAARVPSLTMEVAANSEVGILKRNILNGGRGTSIRRIIDQIPTLLPKLCPCMLMSPISVAQYIDLTAEKFDIVIFDEASQMPTSEAVGAIARGKALVVVGDPKQMPPTSFFSSSQVDEEEAEFDDMESILDDCISLSMPSRYLTWHYRSKHESLIAFSNTQYYEGKLYTFPSVDDKVSKVRLVHVDGTYDKGNTRCNRAEAEAIVREIVRRLQDEQLSQQSIGVISFSQVQQNLIEDLLLEELSHYPELEKKAFANEESDAEPIFVKNLENVQGDERDVILFSIGYGPDKNGHVSMNFGPLNNQGGERRLNVAVSRARYEMIIFSTLRPEQIDLKRTKAKGVEDLKKFLEFGERGVFSTSMSQCRCNDSDELSASIAKELVARGYRVDTAVGRSNFKVDLAVQHPKKSNSYILGILCDGINYYEAKTMRDREVVQPNVLRLLHWNIMRVWSVDWFENKEKVMERIVKKLEQLVDGAMDMERVVPQTEPLKRFRIEDAPTMEFFNEYEQEYVFAKLPDMGAKGIDDVIASASKVKRQLKAIIAVEQPITNTLLYKRIAKIWNLRRVTVRLQFMINSWLGNMYIDPLSDKTVIYWKSEEDSKDYRYYRVHSDRDILDIPLLEVMNAARYVIEQQLSMPKEDLKRMISQTLGFPRKNINMDMMAENAICKLIENGILIDKNEIITSRN